MRDGSPEIEVLCAAARVTLSSEQRCRLDGLLRRDLDWPRLIGRARVHGVAPLLAWQLAAGQQAVPERALAQLRCDLQENAARNLLLSRKLLELLDLFGKAGIAVLPFKGPTLTRCAYGNLALRPFGDLDVLVHPRDAPGARDLLLGHGYRPPARWTTRLEAFSLDTLGQLPLRRDDGILVELHTALLPRSFSFALDVDELWPRRRTVDLLGRPVQALGAEDLLLLLCAHGAKHLWQRLMWVCDVAELLRSCPGLCWEDVLERARRLRAERMLLLGLTLARRLLGAPWPADQDMDPAVRRLAVQVERWLDSDAQMPEVLAGCSFSLRVRERFRDGLRHCLSLAFTPTEADWLAAPSRLPAAGLYPFRLLRLAGKYAGAWLGGGRK
jgi:hypothetical protein